MSLASVGWTGLWTAWSCARREVGEDERGAEMGISSTRGLLYALARLLGDVQAVRRGTVGKRLMRRTAGRLTGRGLGRLFR